MKLVGELKKEVEKIETKEGKKEAIKKAGMELSDEELDQVAGGRWVVGDGGMVYWEDDDEGDHGTPPSPGYDDGILCID